ncbi:MAG: TPM domain-containing protein [Bdellovibrionales bacterium]|nr:TPM domain-containing protein [Bdellovibrionales bacterium]
MMLITNALMSLVLLMASKKIVITSIVLFALFFGFYFYNNNQVKYVFINETSDHRFDESIRVSILAAFKKTGVQHAVIISDKDDSKTTIESAAIKAFSDLNLGRKTSGRAILYYFSPARKTLKIEVGYALEGALPDVMIRGLELAAKSFTYIDRYQDFWAELIITLNNEIGNKDFQKNYVEYDFTTFKFLSGGAGITSNTYTKDWSQIKKELISLNASKKSQFKAQSSVRESLSVYLKSIKSGASDLDLDIITEESKFFRSIYRPSSYQLYRNEKMYSRAEIDQIIIVEQLAFVFYKKNLPVLPIVMKQENNLWRISEPLSWSLFQRFEDSNMVILKYNFSQMTSEFNNYISKRFIKSLYQLEDPISLDFLLSKNLDMSIPKIMLIHFYWIDRFILELNRNDDFNNLTMDNLKFAMDSYTNVGQYSHFLKAYKVFASKYPQDQKIQKDLSFYEDTLNFKGNEWLLRR